MTDLAKMHLIADKIESQLKITSVLLKQLQSEMIAIEVTDEAS